MTFGTEVLAAFISTGNSFIQAIPDLSMLEESGHHVKIHNINAGFQIARALAEEAIRLGYLSHPTAQPLSLEQHPSSMTDVRTKKTQAKRKRILEDARKNHPLPNDSLAPLNKILAAYGRKQFPLNGELATNQKLDDKSKCKQCPSSKDCIIVDRDFTWTRTQCVHCVQNKTKCSLQSIVTERESSVE